jgi:hypothetical protein
MAGVEYNAGTARSTWAMDLAPLRAGVLEAKQLYAQLAAASAQAQQQAQARGTQTVVPRSEAPNAINVGGGAGRNAPDASMQAAKAEAALLRQARAEATLMAAQGNRAGAAQRLEAALVGVNRQSIAAIQTETQLARTSAQLNNNMAVLPRTIAGLSHEAASFAVSSLTMGGAITVVTATLQSFAEAFKFKAELDASRASITVLLQGVRDSKQVFADASAYAAKYKLTQEEMAGALNASTMIMRQSTASTEQILNVMQRLTVLNPAENISGAAFSIKELASGDITSIAERFNVSKAAANKMKAEILAGGDAVKILDQYLQSVGVTSEALGAKLNGPVGKMKDLAIAQEQLKLAQADWAMGPGLVALAVQIDATRGATRLLGGDWATMGQSLQESTRQVLSPLQEILTKITGIKSEWGAIGGGGGSWGDEPEQAAAATATLANQLEISAVAAQAQKAALGDAAQAAYEARDAGGGLTAQSKAAAAALLASGDAGAAAAALLAQSSSQVDLMTAAQYRLQAAAAAAAGGKGSASANATQAKQRDWQATQDLAAAQSRYTEATESSAQRVARLRTELGRLTPGTAAYVDQQTKLAQAERQLSSERTKVGTSADKLLTKTASASNAEAVAQRDAMRRIEDMTRDHYDKLRQLQEDYALSSSRKAEDYQIERQRLLAEGRIAEANALEQKYSLQSKRDAEDAARQRQRQTEQAAQGIAAAQEQAGLKASDRERKRMISGVTLAGDGGAAAIDAAGARQAQAEAGMAGMAGAARGTPLQISVAIAPTQVQIDGGQIVTIIWPQISQLVDAELSAGLISVALTAPPAATSGGVGGATP